MPFYGTGTLLFSDDFTYSDGDLATVGTVKWAAGYWTGQASLRVVSNKAAGPPANGTWRDSYSKTTYSVGSTGLEFIWRNISASNNGSVYSYMHALGLQAASPNGYWARWRDADTHGYAFGELVAGAFTVWHTSGQRPVAGDDVALQFLPDGTITMWVKTLASGVWTQIGFTVIDTTRTSGVIAMETFLADDRWDSVEIREVPAGVTLTPTISWTSIASSVDASAPFTVTGTMPAHVAGDILIACCAKSDAATLTCATAGWAEIVPAQNNANFSTAWFWKRATSSAETAPVITSSTTGGTNSGIYCVMARIRGCVATGTPFEAATLNGSPTTTTTPVSSAITTLGPKRLVLALGFMDENLVISSSPPTADWVQVVNSGTDTGGDAKLTGIVKAQDVAGSVAAVNIGTMTAANYWKTLTLAFIPAPGTYVPPSTSRLKRWNGSSWVVANLKRHNGSSWVPATLKKLP